MRDSDDLLLTVCASTDPLDCNWGMVKIDENGVIESCRSAPGVKLLRYRS
jgi:hypothetical protein